MYKLPTVCLKQQQKNIFFVKKDYFVVEKKTQTKNRF